mmetsp:Transcript_58552/g.137898  ORF Transcript_58552/g.137898 Transcript_58552/m.137898 type:complete len:204 (-) Transcript_58552:14-625(-)
MFDYFLTVYCSSCNEVLIDPLRSGLRERLVVIPRQHRQRLVLTFFANATPFPFRVLLPCEGLLAAITGWHTRRRWSWCRCRGGCCCRWGAKTWFGRLWSTPTALFVLEFRHESRLLRWGVVMLRLLLHGFGGWRLRLRRRSCLWLRLAKQRGQFLLLRMLLWRPVVVAVVLLWFLWSLGLWHRLCWFWNGLHLHLLLGRLMRL